MIRDTEESRAVWALRVPWGLREIAQAAAIIFAGFVFVGATLALVAAAADLDLSDAQVIGVGLIATLVLDVALFALAAVFSVVRFRRGWGALGFRQPSLDQLWIAVATVVAVFVTVGIYGVIITLLDVKQLIPESTLGEDIFDNLGLTVLAGILAVVTAPVAEETFFRGFLFGGMVRKVGFFWAALASGFLFSLVHGQLGTLVPFTLVGMAFAWAYAYTDSLWTSIAAHFIYNGLLFLLAVGGVAE